MVNDLARTSLRFLIGPFPCLVVAHATPPVVRRFDVVPRNFRATRSYITIRHDSHHVGDCLHREPERDNVVQAPTIPILSLFAVVGLVGTSYISICLWHLHRLRSTIS